MHLCGSFVTRMHLCVSFLLPKILFRSHRSTAEVAFGPVLITLIPINTYAQSATVSQQSMLRHPHFPSPKGEANGIEYSAREPENRRHRTTHVPSCGIKWKGSTVIASCMFHSCFSCSLRRLILRGALRCQAQAPTHLPPPPSH